MKTIINHQLSTISHQSSISKLRKQPYTYTDTYTYTETPTQTATDTHTQIIPPQAPQRHQKRQTHNRYINTRQKTKSIYKGTRSRTQGESKTT